MTIAIVVWSFTWLILSKWFWEFAYEEMYKRERKSKEFWKKEAKKWKTDAWQWRRKNDLIQKYNKDGTEDLNN